MQPQDIVGLAPAAKPFASAFLAACAKWEIQTEAQVRALLANVLEETMAFRRMSESFDYQPSALLAVFGRHISPQQALWLGRKKGEAMVPVDRQELIANIIYAGRLGNGDADSGDGWRFRGRGGAQLTFADNYAQASIALFGDERLRTDPDLLLQPQFAMESAAWFFVQHGCLPLADDGEFDDVCRRFNPAGEGLDARRAWLAKINKAIPLSPA